MKDPENGTGISVVKVGAEGKEQAVLLRRSSARWIFLVLGVLAVGIGSAWFIFRHQLEHKAEVGRLTQLLRSTGERVQALKSVANKLGDGDFSSKAKVEAKVEEELDEAQEEHRRAQAALMKRQGLPDSHDVAAADRAAQLVPKTIQLKMVEEFRHKAKFLVWATAPDQEAAWRRSPRFGKMIAANERDHFVQMEDAYERAQIGTVELLDWARGNISAGNWPPPVSALQGVITYLDYLTEEAPEDDDPAWEGNLYVSWDAKKKKVTSKKNKEMWSAADTAIRKLVAVGADGPALKKDPTPTFKSIYAALVQFHLTEWLFPGDDPQNKAGLGMAFSKYKQITEEEQDDDDGEFDMEWDEDEDDEAEE